MADDYDRMQESLKEAMRKGEERFRRQLEEAGVRSDAETELAVVRAMLAAALAELRKLEWSNGKHAQCPRCYMHKSAGHAEGCTLAAALARAEGRG
jgi:hypothetical protein